MRWGATLENILVDLLAFVLGVVLALFAGPAPGGAILPALLLAFALAGCWKSWWGCGLAILFTAGMLLPAVGLPPRSGVAWSALASLGPTALAVVSAAGLGALLRRFVPRPRDPSPAALAGRRRRAGGWAMASGAGLLVLPFPVDMLEGARLRAPGSGPPRAAPGMAGRRALDPAGGGDLVAALAPAGRRS